MDVLVTGAYGRCGTALIDHLHDRVEYDFTYLNRSDRPDDHPYGGYETIIADVADADALRSAAGGHDAIVHMAAFPHADGDWSDVLEPNIIGTYNALEAARLADVESFVFLSSNHVMGMYEEELAPEIYHGECDIVLDETDPVRPDSEYGASKVFGEALGRYYVERYDSPSHLYALRVCTVNDAEYDHPYGDAEQGVDEGRWDRGGEEYDTWVARMKAMWQSRRDFAHQVDCCLQDDDVEFGIFAGVSDNRRRWFSIEQARARIGYDPQDDGEEWTAPPE